MENKPRRSYGRRTTDENRPDRPKTRRTYGKQDDGAKPRRYEKDDPSVKRPYRAKSDSDRPQKTFDRPKKTYGDRPKKPAVARQTVEEGGLVRLNKFIANSGICSRREAENAFRSGRPSNGEGTAGLFSFMFQSSTNSSRSPG